MSETILDGDHSVVRPYVNGLAVFDKRTGEPLEVVPAGANPGPMVKAWDARFGGWRERNGHR